MAERLKDTFGTVYRTLAFNFRTLALFEILYRAFGVLIIFPLVRWLFLLSIDVYGLPYVTNALLVDYLTHPTTVLFVLVILVVFSIYILIEMVHLSVLFRLSKQGRKVPLGALLRLSFARIVRPLRRAHVVAVLLPLLFFVLVETLQVVGVAATVSLPPYLTQYIEEELWLRLLTLGLLVGFFVLFIEFGHLLQVYILGREKDGSYRVVRRLIRGRRLRIAGEFALLNVVINLILYAFYLLLILLASGFSLVTFGQDLALGVLLTVLYVFYVIVGIVAALTIVPINYALAFEWYDRGRERHGIPEETPLNPELKPLRGVSRRWLKRAAVLGGVFLLVANFFTVLGVIAEERSPVAALNDPDIIAHRGASWDAPENTLAAVELAMEQRADWIEFDVHETADGEAVVLHDYTLGRTTDDEGNRRVEDVTLEEIRELDAGSWFDPAFEGEPVPTLEEVFELTAGETKLYVELKPDKPSLTETTVELIETYEMEDDAKVMSFHRDTLRDVKTLNEEIDTVLLMATFFGDFSSVVRAPDFDHFAIEKHFLLTNDHYIDRVQSEGKTVQAWTVNSQRMLANVTDAGVDGIITDRPVLAREIAYSQRTSDFLDELLDRLFDRD